MSKLFGIASTAASAAGLMAYARYRREMRAIRAAVESGSTIAETAAGPIEFAETGDGEPMFIIHGAGGGYDQGLLIGRDIGEGYRVVAPSRFGYLKTPVPKDRSPAAQADSHAALLDFLEIRQSVVVGVSAGAPSAIEMAFRHPDRVSALILLVPRTYDPAQSVGVDQSIESQAVLRMIKASADFLFWLAMRVARRSVVRFLGVLPEVEANAPDQDRARVTEVMQSMLPLSARVRGITVDSSIELSPWPLERVRVPTLIVSADDDLFKTLAGAKFTAEHIPAAQLYILKSGGHLMVGQGAKVRRLVTDFLADSRASRSNRATGPERTLEKVAAA